MLVGNQGLADEEKSQIYLPLKVVMNHWQFLSEICSDLHFRKVLQCNWMIEMRSGTKWYCHERDFHPPHLSRQNHVCPFPSCHVWGLKIWCSFSSSFCYVHSYMEIYSMSQTLNLKKQLCNSDLKSLMISFNRVQMP